MTHWTQRPVSEWKRALLASSEFQAGQREGAAAARDVLAEVRAGLRSPEDGERLDDYVQAFAEDAAAAAPAARGLRGTAADAYRLGAIDGAESVTENLGSSGTRKAGGMGDAIVSKVTAGGAARPLKSFARVADALGFARREARNGNGQPGQLVRVEDGAGRVVGEFSYKASGNRKAGGAVAKLTGQKKKDFLARMAAGRRKAGRVTGATVKRKKKGSKRAGSTAIVRGPAVLPKRRGHGRGAIGKGTPAVRLARVEHAVIDLAKVNNVLVSKVIDHEKRLNKVESVAAQWARGRRK